jgi:small-conductance mechanosensitive channel
VSARGEHRLRSPSARAFVRGVNARIWPLLLALLATPALADDAGAARGDAGAPAGHDAARDAGATTTAEAPAAEPAAQVPAAGSGHGPGSGGPLTPAPIEPAPEPHELPEGFAATYHEEPSPLVFRVAGGGRSARARAKEASGTLTDALELASESSGELVVKVRVEDGAALVRVGEMVVTSYYDDDAAAESIALSAFAEQMEGRLKSWVPSQLRRKALQLAVLHIFLSVFFLVIAFVTLRALGGAFDRWDAELDEKRHHLKAISILRVPVFSGNALGGALAFGLATGRVLSYVVTVVAAIAAVLSQFDVTRPLLRRLVTGSVDPVVRGFEIVVGALPGLLVAGVLVVGARAGLRVVNLLLDGVTKKRIVYKRLPPSRVPVFRVVVQVGVFLLVTPLAIAVAFGSYGTPLEVLALGAGIIVLIGAVPVVASYIVGIVVLWREGLQPGDWVQVGRVSGEVTRLSVAEVSLVPEGGGTISIPMLHLLLNPLRRLRTAPEVSFELTVTRDRPAKELLALVAETVHAVEPAATVECIDICRDWIRTRIAAPSVREGVRQHMLLALSDAVDDGAFELPSLRVGRSTDRE